MTAPPRVLVVAGEPSGDAHAARAVAALRDRCAGVAVDAVGGPALCGAGANVRWPIDRLSARGFTEAVAAIPRHLALHRELGRGLRSGEYDAVLLVDYPGFNLAMARSAHAAGVPVLYYVAPQLWAWGAWRLPRLRRDVTHLAAVLPFEPAYFSPHGITTTFVGHPLLDVKRPDRAAARAALDLSGTVPVLGLFPGSRPDEIARHWPAFRDAAREARRRHPGLEVIVAALESAEYPGGEEMTLWRADPKVVFAAADAAICKSGTTTLEAALSDLPMVVAYRMTRGTYAIARRLVRVPYIGLVNIVAGGVVTPELVQHAAEPAALAAAVEPLLDRDGVPARAQREGLRLVRERLGQPGTAGRVADLLLGVAA